jgi:tRNA threonylcarbamoyladenosine biosynthesis protein TsaB
VDSLPLVLAFDSGSPRASAAVARGDTVLAARDSPRDGAGFDLLALVAATLDQAGRAPHELAGVVALAGPGSFTGVRVACAAALGLSAATGARATGVATLEALALGAPEGAGEIVTLVDALRGEWFVQRWLRGPGLEATPLGPPRTTTPGAARLGDPARLVGEGANRFAAAAGLAAWSTEASPAPAAPVARAAALGRWEWDAGRLRSPLYLRPPAATPAGPLTGRPPSG